MNRGEQYAIIYLPRSLSLFPGIDLGHRSLLNSRRQSINERPKGKSRFMHNWVCCVDQATRTLQTRLFGLFETLGDSWGFCFGARPWQRLLFHAMELISEAWQRIHRRNPERFTASPWTQKQTGTISMHLQTPSEGTKEATKNPNQNDQRFEEPHQT